MKKRTLQELLSTLTLEEKASLLSGRDFWRTKSIPQKGVPSLRMADGPHGLRREDLLNQRKNHGKSRPATCFPTESALACTWDPSLMKEVGEALAQECHQQKVQLLLGPGVNIKRSPLCGRNFEYLSEDPLLSGVMGAAYIQGVQKKGVGASLKHFALNNQESYRMRVSAQADERTLRELYLKPFEIAVKQAKPATVMASYNRVNGVHATEHMQLLKEILRGEWGFNGVILSDWSALNNRVRAVRAGLDLEMPGSGGETDSQIVKAVQEGHLTQQQVDDCCLRVLQLVFFYLQQQAKQLETLQQEQENHKKLAKKAALRSVVLFKNDGMLPLDAKENIAVIGALAEHTRFQGAGSSLVNAKGISILQAMKQAGHAYVNYAGGYALQEDGIANKKQKQQFETALHYAKTAKKVIYVMGLTELFESEGFDRTHLKLPDNQVQLLRAVLEVNSDVTVVLIGGAPVEMPWFEEVRAILYAGLGGEQIGPAVYDLLFGIENPSGKLAETWPLKLEDVPCAKYYPMGPRFVTYKEGIYVGYRYYDKAQKQVRFPFGYGLSYTDYIYRQLSCTVLAQQEAVQVRFLLKNIGQRSGQETAQIYIEKKDSAVHRPLRVLAGFTNVFLEPQQEKEVEVMIPLERFSIWDTNSHRFAVEQGTYEVFVGANSRDLPLATRVYLQGEVLSPLPHESALGSYGTLTNNDFTDEMFDVIHHLPCSNEPLRVGEYTMETTLGEMRASRAARMIERFAVRVSLCVMHFSTNPQVNRLVCETAVRDLPFKNLALNLNGKLSFAQVQYLLDICNGKVDFKTAIRTIKPWFQSRKH